MDSTASRPAIRFTGHNGLVRRLVLSTLLGKAVRIFHIHDNALASQGLAPHEDTLLRLIETITNGTVTEISYNGTSLHYSPGLITGTRSGLARHDGFVPFNIPAASTRGISYFLLPLCLLAPFSKSEIKIFFSGPGLTTSATQYGDVSLHTFRSTILPLFARLGLQSGIEIKVTQSSDSQPHVRPGSSGVLFVFPRPIRTIPVISWTTTGVVKSIRGVAYCTNVSVSNNRRAMDAARKVLNEFAANVYVFSDVTRDTAVRADKESVQGKPGNKGFGLSLIAQTTTSGIFSADLSSDPAGGSLPEAIGIECAYQLLDAIDGGGSASPLAADMLLTFMMMGTQDVGRLRLSRAIVRSRRFLNHCRDARQFDTPTWNIKEIGDGDFTVQIVGAGIGTAMRKS